MASVQPGDRVTIHGLKAKPELNGQSAVLVGPAPNGRINVRLDSGQEIALKEENLGVQAPGGGGGGMPGFGGMPGMAGMPDPHVLIEQVGGQLRQALASAGLNVPARFTSQQLLMGLAAAVLLGGYLLTRLVSMSVLGLAGLAGYGALATEQGRRVLDQGSRKASSALGRPVGRHVLVGLLCLAVAAGGHALLGGRARAPAGGASDLAYAVREAYEQGYKDGEAGVERRPPQSATPLGGGGEGKAAAAGGMGSLLKYGAVAYQVYKLGSTPAGWNAQAAFVNAKANPLQLGMMLLLLSGVLI